MKNQRLFKEMTDQGKWDVMYGQGSRCPYCTKPLEVVEVHGHSQCASCGTNINPCCGGKECP